jgi:uncharacterized protein
MAVGGQAVRPHCVQVLQQLLCCNGRLEGTDKKYMSKGSTSAVKEASDNLRKAKNSLANSNKPKLRKVDAVEAAQKQLEKVQSANKIVKAAEEYGKLGEKTATKSLKKTVTTLYEQGKKVAIRIQEGDSDKTYWLQPDGSYINKTTTENGKTTDTTPNKPQ